jgi:hypothetical protein
MAYLASFGGFLAFLARAGGMPVGAKTGGQTMSLLAELSADPEFWGSCPNCGADIRLMDAQLFSVTDKLPEIALLRIGRLKAAFKARRKELAKTKELMRRFGHC